MVFKRLITTLCCRCNHEPSIELDGEVDLFHFVLLRAIGRGAYGRVRVVEHKTTGGLYALKYVDKSKCLKSKAAANIVQERLLLEEINHPFITNMYYAFQDELNCYFILDLMLGGDLRFHRMSRGSLGENAVRFYVAEISSALAYLHQNGICHRDVKPDNILLDLHGHAHLTDFNVAIHYSENKLHSTVAGTMVYMAPEVIDRSGYSWQIDYWSLGVTAFECLFFGIRPFADKCKNAEVVKKSITQDVLVFPPDSDKCCSADGKAALAALLNKDPSERLGCKSRSKRRGQFQLRSHRWFKCIDWEKLDARQLHPPFVPDNKNLNCDSHELEELLVPDRPLAQLKRMSLQTLEKATAEKRHLEANFHPYNFEKMPGKSYYPHNEPIRALAPNRASLLPPPSGMGARTGTPAPAVTPQLSCDEAQGLP